MLIDEIEVYHVAMPLLAPYRTGFGAETVIESVLLRLSGGGLCVWSESTPFGEPFYGPDWTGGAFEVIRRWLGPAVVGVPLETPQDVADTLGFVRGHRFAKAAIDIAWWTLDAALAGRPLHEHIAGGSPIRDRAEVGQALGSADDVETILSQTQAAVDAGYRRVKLKVMPGWDLEVVRAVRHTFPKLTLHVDANASYTLADLDTFRALDGLELAMIEQPLAWDDLRDHAELQRALETPVCLDESVVSRRHLELALELGSCRAVNIKPGRVGGLTESIAVHDLARDAGIRCWVGGMLESALGGALCAALQTLPGFDYPGDVFPSSRFYAADLAAPGLEFDHGPAGELRAMAATGVGLPQTPDLDRLEPMTVSSWSSNAAAATA